MFLTDLWKWNTDTYAVYHILLSDRIVSNPFSWGTYHFSQEENSNNIQGEFELFSMGIKMIFPLSEISIDLWYFNTCPAEPGYTLPLQTV